MGYERIPFNFGTISGFCFELRHKLNWISKPLIIVVIILLSITHDTLCSLIPLWFQLNTFYWPLRYVGCGFCSLHRWGIDRTPFIQFRLGLLLNHFCIFFCIVFGSMVALLMIYCNLFVFIRWNYFSPFASLVWPCLTSYCIGLVLIEWSDIRLTNLYRNLIYPKSPSKRFNFLFDLGILSYSS